MFRARCLSTKLIMTNGSDGVSRSLFERETRHESTSDGVSKSRREERLRGLERLQGGRVISFTTHNLPVKQTEKP